LEVFHLFSIHVASVFYSYVTKIALYVAHVAVRPVARFFAGAGPARTEMLRWDFETTLCDVSRAMLHETQRNVVVRFFPWAMVTIDLTIVSASVL
jgi:hypothetical protein